MDAPQAWSSEVRRTRVTSGQRFHSSLAADDESYRKLVAITERFTLELTAHTATERFWTYVAEVEDLFLYEGEGYVQRMFARKDLATRSLAELSIVRFARAHNDPSGVSGSSGRTDKFDLQLSKLFPHSNTDGDMAAVMRELDALKTRHAAAVGAAISRQRDARHVQ